MSSTHTEEARFFKYFLPIFFVLILCICCIGLIFVSSCRRIPKDFFDVEQALKDDALILQIGINDMDLEINHIQENKP